MSIFKFHPDLAMHWFQYARVWCWLIQSEERNFLVSSSSTSHLESIILWILLANYFEISMFSSYEEKSKIFSSMQYRVFSIQFHTIVECFPTIKFGLIYMKDSEGEHKALYVT